jgi:DNA-nicking Smr family endonuclease
MAHILDGDESQISNCWKCLTIIAMTELMHGYPKEALEDFQKAANVVKRDTGSVPSWLTSRADVAAAEAAKQSH